MQSLLSSVVKKFKTVKNLVNRKSGKFLKTVFFFSRVDTINAAEVKITRKPIKNDKGIGPIKSNLDLL